jgi:hypothetical protein
MRTRVVGVALSVLFAGAAVLFAAGSEIGTWKLNEAKSKFSAGAAKNTTVVYSADGDKTKVTIDGVDGTGKAAHSVWAGKFDGKDYPVEGDATSTRAYTRVDANTLDVTLKKDGKVTGTAHIVQAADGKTRTVTTTGTDPKGNKISGTAVYERQ